MQLSMKTVLLVAAVLAVAAHVAAGQKFTWSNLQPLGAFQTTKLDLTTNTGTFEAGANATMVLSGGVTRLVPGGHVELTSWEYMVAKPTFKENFEYCYCHGYPAICEPCKPIHLVYNNCNEPTEFTLTINYIMPPAQASGNYSISLLSGHYYPKEIAVEVFYLYDQ